MSWFSPILMVGVPLFVAFLIPLLGYIHKKAGLYAMSLTLLFNTVAGFYFLPKVFVKPIRVIVAGYKPPFGINLAITPFSIFMACLISLMGFLVSLYLLKDNTTETQEKFSMLILLVVMGSTGIVLTGDIFNMFVFLEITSISSYALTAIKKDRKGSEAGIKFLLVGSISSTLLLLGIALIYNQLGTLNIADIANRFSQMNPKVAFLAVSFLFLGFGIESEMFPLNAWAPDVYQGAPAPVAALFSAVTVKAGLYAMVRFLFTVVNMPVFVKALLVFGVLTVIVSELSALRQKDVRRMLGYSSLGQIGLILFAIGIGTTGALKGAIFHFINHAILKATLFLTIGLLAKAAGGSTFEDLKGIGKKYPFLAGIFAIAALGVMGFPPLNGFMSKLMILTAAVKAEHILLVMLILAASVIEGVYYFRVLQIMFKEPEPTRIEKKAIPLFSVIPLVILVVAIVGIGLFPGVLTPYLKGVTMDIMNRSNYIAAMLGSVGGGL
ncbi:multicomponent Na+:H+ antiporter subunit D [Thermotomaculum hydrothermale]|uniref:Multicomponent Na+:H+ antiporter subunit D n=1 Tax=Thermotomaculum hydrothermale TaxID=981385 RepID=A0A7R6PPE0_9BACT|nr:proton-conducting transporter membrane subunit [Thermotomaculum hydrothermale]BBB33383.1 multicomponent Na+:H+ antiporter subunit D [Thermotomaculum hydrothermale]